MRRLGQTDAFGVAPVSTIDKTVHMVVSRPNSKSRLTFDPVGERILQDPLIHKSGPTSHNPAGERRLEPLLSGPTSHNSAGERKREILLHKSGPIRQEQSSTGRRLNAMMFAKRRAHMTPSLGRASTQLKFGDWR